MKYKGERVPDDIHMLARQSAKEAIRPTGCEGTQYGDRGHVYPPEHRRCQSLKTDGERCPNWTIPGSTRCRKHGGKKDCYVAKILKKGASKTAGITALKGAPEIVQMFYRHRLSKSLADRLQESLDRQEHEQLELFEELALMREAAFDCIKMYDVASYAYDHCTDEKQKQVLLELKITSGVQMKSAPSSRVLSSGRLPCWARASRPST